MSTPPNPAGSPAVRKVASSASSSPHLSRSRPRTARCNSSINSTFSVAPVGPDGAEQVAVAEQPLEDDQDMGEQRGLVLVEHDNSSDVGHRRGE